MNFAPPFHLFCFEEQQEDNRAEVIVHVFAGSDNERVFWNCIFSSEE